MCRGGLCALQQRSIDKAITRVRKRVGAAGVIGDRGSFVRLVWRGWLLVSWILGVEHDGSLDHSGGKRSVFERRANEKETEKAGS